MEASARTGHYSLTLGADRMDTAFLIWFADISMESTSRESNEIRPPGIVLGLDAKNLSSIAGEVHSYSGIISKMEESDKKLSDRLHAIEKEHAVIKWALMLFVGLIIGYVAKMLGR